MYSDEVVVHFSDLGGFFEKARDLLKPGSCMLNKELHFASSRFMKVTRDMVFINKLAGETGYYRLLHDELNLLDRAGFDIVRIEQMALSNYQWTLEGWFANIRESQAQLEALVDAEDVRRFRTYLQVLRKSHGGPSMTLDLVLARTRSTTPLQRRSGQRSQASISKEPTGSNCKQSAKKVGETPTGAPWWDESLHATVRELHRLTDGDVTEGSTPRHRPTFEGRMSAFHPSWMAK